MRKDCIEMLNDFDDNIGNVLEELIECKLIIEKAQDRIDDLELENAKLKLES